MPESEPDLLVSSSYTCGACVPRWVSMQMMEFDRRKSEKSCFVASFISRFYLLGR